jgi:hypothetical protein
MVAGRKGSSVVTRQSIEPAVPKSNAEPFLLGTPAMQKAGRYASGTIYIAGPETHGVNIVQLSFLL